MKARHNRDKSFASQNSSCGVDQLTETKYRHAIVEQRPPSELRNTAHNLSVKESESAQKSTEVSDVKQLYNALKEKSSELNLLLNKL